MVNLQRTGIRIQLQVRWDHMMTTLDYLLIWISSVCLYTQFTLSSPADLLSDQDQDIDVPEVLKWTQVWGTQSQQWPSSRNWWHIVMDQKEPRSMVWPWSSTLGSVLGRCCRSQNIVRHLPNVRFWAQAPLLHERPAEDILCGSATVPLCWAVTLTGTPVLLCLLGAPPDGLRPLLPNRLISVTNSPPLPPCLNPFWELLLRSLSHRPLLCLNVVVLLPPL